jgi:hypothetical protein
MHPYLEAKLQLAPTELFTRGACHIYARALKLQFPNLQLRRAGSQIRYGIGTQSAEGQHVYCYTDGVLLDVSRIILEDDLLKEHQWTAWDSTENELFTVYEKSEKGPLNPWRQYLDEEFVRRATSIADWHISSRTEEIHSALSDMKGPKV